ncbi:hypothetical protein FEP90_04068 [Burkholderia multivorans]|nr:hypothetical protein [Burkholderia multivorans]MDR8769034.1 hypothetical protein [Burkholderia multivorans]MDR8774302.1 hypothetical protein [Burkholderia multivorans]MDR8792595.1 hypothetical protein [Burkholderia multivorans]MDR8795447.1 hypothetical protein [Burkholderia multivorans]
MHPAGSGLRQILIKSAPHFAQLAKNIGEPIHLLPHGRLAQRSFRGAQNMGRAIFRQQLEYAVRDRNIVLEFEVVTGILLVKLTLYMNQLSHRTCPSGGDVRARKFPPCLKVLLRRRR